MVKSKPFTEQLALVTGGGTGIGRALSEALAIAGVRVVIASRRPEVLQRTAEELNRKCGAERVFPCAFDIRAREQVDSLVNHIDILVNNSGLAVPETVGHPYIGRHSREPGNDGHSSEDW